jgi:hypothetical protein
MSRPRKVKQVDIPEIAKKYVKKDHAVLPDGKIIESGEIFKVKGEHGLTFQFEHFVTNIENDAQWVDCIQLYRGRYNCRRAFRVDRIKKLPKKRGKRVRRTEDS